MQDFITQYWSQIASAVGGAIGGSLLTFTMTRNNVKGTGSVVDQSKSRVGRDQIGNITERTGRKK